MAVGGLLQSRWKLRRERPLCVTLACSPRCTPLRGFQFPGRDEWRPPSRAWCWAVPGVCSQSVCDAAAAPKRLAAHGSQGQRRSGDEPSLTPPPSQSARRVKGAIAASAADAAPPAIHPQPSGCRELAGRRLSRTSRMHYLRRSASAVAVHAQLSPFHLC